jgi:hypothetical protein
MEVADRAVWMFGASVWVDGGTLPRSTAPAVPTLLRNDRTRSGHETRPAHTAFH